VSRWCALPHIFELVSAGRLVSVQLQVSIEWMSRSLLIFLSSSCTSCTTIRSSYRHGPPFISPRPLLWFLICLRHTVVFLGLVISSSQGLYLHRRTQRREIKEKLPCLKLDLNPRSNVWKLKVDASHRVATESANFCVINPLSAYAIRSRLIILVVGSYASEG
jgi:hypothetical protein